MVTSEGLLKSFAKAGIITAALLCSLGSTSVKSAVNIKDLNNDGVIDRLDNDIAAAKYNSSDAAADINGDSIVDIYDLANIASNYDEDYKDNDFYAIGNSHGNLLNSSYAAAKGDTVYFRNTQDGNTLYKSKLNREGKIKLSNDVVTSLNLVGDRLYYSNQSDGGKIYSINIDGTGRKLVSSDSKGDFAVSSGYIFYRSVSDGKLYKIISSGSGKTNISNDSMDKFVPRGEYVYYSNSGDGKKLYRIKNDGTGRKRITADSVLNFAMDKDNIYYANSSDGNKVYKVDLEGQAKEKVIDKAVLNLNLWDTYIYYSSADGSLYKINKDGTEETNIQQEKLSTNLSNNKMSIDEGWIFYNNSEDENRLYAIDVNGNSKRDMDTFVEGRVSATSLNLRKSPCISSASLGMLSKGQKLEILSQVYHQKHLTDKWEPETWYKVSYDKDGQVITGYVGTSYVLIVNDNREDDWLGVLSGKYESNGDPGQISDLAGDKGGKSYGICQFSSALGSLDTFIYWLADYNTNFYNTLKDAKKADGDKFGTKFDEAWTKLARENEDEFLRLQLKSIRENYYDKAAAKIKRDFKVDINTKSFAYRNVVWSTVVQHGVYGSTRTTAESSKPGVLTAVGYTKPERELIDLVYKERAKFNLYFSSYDVNVPSQKKLLDSLASRFSNEAVDALSMYDYEKQ
jgi:hypothetical protein